MNIAQACLNAAKYALNRIRLFILHRLVIVGLIWMMIGLVCRYGRNFVNWLAKDDVMQRPIFALADFVDPRLLVLLLFGVLLTGTILYLCSRYFGSRHDGLRIGVEHLEDEISSAATHFACGWLVLAAVNGNLDVHALAFAGLPLTLAVAAFPLNSTPRPKDDGVGNKH